MEISETLLERLKSEIPGYKSTISINTTNYDKDTYRVSYIEVDFFKTNAPIFSYSTKDMNLKSEIRDMMIDKILNSKRPETDFDVESIIYTEEQREKLYRLRNEANDRMYGFDELERVKKEYSDSFSIGQKVYYNNGLGIITFKHENKNNKEQYWSVKVENTEYRYIPGTRLLNRVSEDLSYIEVDKELDKLSTVKLLKRYKRQMRLNKGKGDLKIKRILQDREHIEKKGEVKIVNLYHE